LSAREFLEFSGDLYHVERRLRDRRIEALLKLFDLHERANDFLSGYSRGMRQKVSLAAALLHDPQVLFLDEPTVGLDPQSARQMKDILQDFCREGKTVFFSTHILEIAERMCSQASHRIPVSIDIVHLLSLAFFGYTAVLVFSSLLFSLNALLLNPDLDLLLAAPYPVESVLAGRMVVQVLRLLLLSLLFTMPALVVLAVANHNPLIPLAFAGLYL